MVEKFWALVQAEYPEGENLLDQIFKNIENYGWIRIENDSRNYSSTWKKSFDDDKRGQLIKHIPSDFLRASMDFKIYPTLITHIGRKEPFLMMLADRPCKIDEIKEIITRKN